MTMVTHAAASSESAPPRWSARRWWPSGAHIVPVMADRDSRSGVAPPRRSLGYRFAMTIGRSRGAKGAWDPGLAHLDHRGQWRRPALMVLRRLPHQRGDWRGFYAADAGRPSTAPSRRSTVRTHCPASPGAGPRSTTSWRARTDRAHYQHVRDHADRDRRRALRRHRAGRRRDRRYSCSVLVRRGAGPVRADHFEHRPGRWDRSTAASQSRRNRRPDPLFYPQNGNLIFVSTLERKLRRRLRKAGAVDLRLGEGCEPYDRYFLDLAALLCV